MELSEPEIRVLGCMLEKQRTTPEQYPLSLNSLRLACNQSTNRDPVVEYDEHVIRDALHRLERRGFTRLASGRGSRAIKHRHLLSEALPMSDPEQAMMCVLMLRGPQTPGELKQRSDRLHPFPDLEDVQRTLSALIERGLVARMGRRPGQKEERYGHLLGGNSPGPAHHAGAATGSTPADGLHRQANGAVRRERDELAERLERLEREVGELRAALSELRGEPEGPGGAPAGALGAPGRLP